MNWLDVNLKKPTVPFINYDRPMFLLERYRNAAKQSDLKTTQTFLKTKVTTCIYFFILLKYFITVPSCFSFILNLMF